MELVFESLLGLFAAVGLGISGVVVLANVLDSL